MQVEFRRVEWPFASVFRISYRSQTAAEAVWVELTDRSIRGRGEALGVFYHGETVDFLLAQLDAVRSTLETGISRSDLQKLLPPGGARNAVDCALWDLEAKRAGRRAWDLAGIPDVKPLLTAYTLSMDTPIAMAAAATGAQKYSILKLKLGGAGDIERVAAVRDARPDAMLIVDANQAWSERQLREFTPELASLGVKLIEQPLAADDDHSLADFKSPVPLCADEACQTTESLPSVVGKYQYINIKLDKTGGLTEALRLAHAARAANLDIMVGCMAGSSLSMAPHFVIGQLCSVIDLDGPLLSTKDVSHAIRYEGSKMHAPKTILWG
jgi:L-alanine-DL-glutamate epimerase-like enolase superfamily enzyme